jgi:hypothetical protein
VTDINKDALIEACRNELEALWTDLRKAIDSAINCTWSIEALHIKGRIQKLTRLVGPTPWEAIPIPLLEQGIYQKVHEEIGVTAEVDMEGVARTRASTDARRQWQEERRG